MTDSRLLWCTLVSWWKTRHLSDKEYRQHLLQEVIDARNQLAEEYKDVPASRELIETFDGIDRFIEQAKAQC